MPRKPRNLKKTPKFLMPKNYRDFLRKAIADQHGREATSNHKPVEGFSPACLKNIHAACNGHVMIHSGKDIDRQDCLCICHDIVLD